MSMQRVVCAFAVMLVLAASSASASTGNFTSPLTTNVILSVDVNGGVITSQNSTTEGSNGPSGSPTLSADPFGVTWSPWGGPTNTNGDGTQLPNSNGGGVQADTITKAFGGITASISAAGTLSNYSTNGTGHLNGRDRGAPTGAANDNDLFRDLVFAGASGANVQSTNFLKLSFSGLQANGVYKVAAYSFDTTGAHSMNWTATPPTSNLQNGDHLGYNPNPTNIFAAPSDEQTITWTGGGANPAPAVFLVTADGTGNLALWGWGGNGVSGNQSADTSYIDGFQLAVIPEASAFAMGGAVCGMIGLTYIARRNRKEQAAA
jgi:hypothetical protein